MHNLRYGLSQSAFFLTAFLALCRSGWTQGQPVTFSGVGDVPYSNSETVVFQKQIANHNIYSPSSFFVHVGDVGAGGSSTCAESNYSLVANIMKGLRVPTYVVTGDNEIKDCSDRNGAFKLWNKYYDKFQNNFCGAPPTEHQAENPANFAFILNGVLFIGLDHSGSPMPENLTVDWMKLQFQTKGTQVRAAVLFAHFAPNTTTTFSTPFRQAAVTFGKPILFLHGHGHSWSVGYPFPEKNIMKIQVNKGASEDPVEFTVTMNTSSPATAFLIKRKPWLIKTVVNMPPCADAGPDQILASKATSTTLPGKAGDDGDPLGSTVTTVWSKVSGPGAVSFDNQASPTTIARFAVPGIYVLRLTANDTEFQTSDEVTITSQGFANIKPLLAVNDLKISEGDDGTLTAFFTVTLANPNGKTVTVDYEVKDSTATNGSDYIFSPQSGSLTFSNWTKKRRLAVTIIGDEIDEQNDEIFFIRLSNAVNADIADDEGFATIMNDDMPAPPNEPTTLRAKTIAANAVDISWKDMSNNEDGFKLERKAGLAPFVEIATLGSSVNFYNDAGLNPGTIYFYRAYAFNTHGGSVYSNTDSTETASGVAATPGVNLALNRPAAASSVSTTFFPGNAVDGNSKDTYWRSGTVPLDAEAWLRVDLGSVVVIGRATVRWKDVYYSKNYSLQVSTNNVTWTTVYNNKTSAGGNEDFWFAPSLGRYVRLLMTNGVKDSYRINEFEVYAAEISSAPAAPANLVATATSSSSIGIKWSHTSNDEYGFEIERAIGGGAFNYVATLGPNATFYNDSGLRAKTNYVYRVRAYNFVDDSDYSNQAAAVTLTGSAAPSPQTNLTYGKILSASSADATKPVSLAADTNGATYWSTTTNAASWLRVDFGQALPVGRIVVRWQDTFYAKTYEIQVSNDGSNWTPVYQVLAGASGAQDFTFPQAAARYVRIYMTTANKSFYQIQEFEIYTGATTSIAKRGGETAEAAETNVVPDEYVLEQNYPNPFNPNTQIRFGLPKDSRVTIKLFSITGAEIRTLVDADYSAGTHTISFHARNLSSGTYFYVMQAGTVRQVRRLTLLK